MTEINLSREFMEEFSKLQKKSEAGNGEAIYLLKLIEKGMAKLSVDYKAGQQIKRNLWPDYYTKKYDVDNLWRLHLDDSWRMIYSVTHERISILALILDVIDHKEYNRRFGYQ